MSAWVTDVPNMNGRSTPLQYRFLVAMQGALGVGANLNKWSDQDSQFAAKMIALYKRIRPTIQTGNLYRLLSPRISDITANEYVSSDGKQTVLFVFRRAQQFGSEVSAIRLCGLDAKSVYRLESVDGKLRNGAELSGAYLMNRGVNVDLRGDYDSTALILERIE
jgi:alpha-galactosidase